MKIKKQKAAKTRQERFEDFSAELPMSLGNPKKRKHTTDHDAENFNTQKHDDGSGNVPFKEPSSENLENLKHPEDIGLCNVPFKNPSSKNSYKLKHEEHGLCNVPSRQSSKRAPDGKKCTIFAKLINSGIVSDYEPVFYLKKKDKSVMKEGAITRNGILCRCCHQSFLLTNFEVHAGSSLHRPSANMFLQDGRSLMQCQQALRETSNQKEAPTTWNGNEKAVEISNTDQESEGTSNAGSPECSSSQGCSIMQCQQDLCETSNESFLQGAVKTSNANQKAVETSTSNQETSGTSTAASPDCSNSQTSCISKLKDTNENTCEICGDGGQLVLCDGCPSAFHASCLSLDEIPEGDWHCLRCRCGWCGLGKVQKSGRTDACMLSCSQCNIPYHKSCVIENLQEEIEGPWFCSKTCKHVFKTLRRLVGREFPLDKGLSWMLLRSFKEDMDIVVKKAAKRSTERWLSGAFKLLEQCFNPIVDSETGIDLLSQIVFNRKSHTQRLDCRRFYTIVLMKGEKLVSAATIRTHGNMMAEMPLIGTSYQFRNLGMCKALMQALEALLRDVAVYKLIIPSIDELVASWTHSFGFKLMSLKDRKELSGANELSFPGTMLLQKNLL